MIQPLDCPNTSADESGSSLSSSPCPFSSSNLDFFRRPSTIKLAAFWPISNNSWRNQILNPHFEMFDMVYILYIFHESEKHNGLRRDSYCWHVVWDIFRQGPSLKSRIKYTSKLVSTRRFQIWHRFAIWLTVLSSIFGQFFP